MELDANFVYTLVIISVFVWMLMKFFLGFEGFGNAVVVTIIGFILLPNILSQGIASFLIIIAIGGLAVQQVYRASFTDSVVVTLIAMVAGSYLLTSFM